MLRILLVGSQGQVGRSIVEVVAANSADVELFSFSRSELDITHETAVQSAFEKVKPSILINAAAYTAVDQAEEEPELAQRVNVDAVGYLAKVCAAHDIPMLHISTDYVFDGSRCEPYRENDLVSPLGVYGKTKLVGEELLRSSHVKHIILRTSWVFSPYGHNFVKTMRRLFNEREQLSVVNDQVGGPTSAWAIAQALLTIAKAVRGKEFSEWGIYHFSGAPAVSWWGFAEKINALVHDENKKVKAIVAINSEQFPTKAKRPKYSVLNTRKIQRIFGIAPCDWCKDLESMNK